MTTTAPAAVDSDPGYSRGTLVAGLLGRSWLWFLVGCLAVTLLPMLIGWRPYVVESGSMEPRISVGDVVIASPQDDPEVLLGRVTVFSDPSREDTVVTHRVVAQEDDGDLVTKGDANPTVDSERIQVSDVHGIGRLLVRFVGLPVVWIANGQWLFLLLGLASLGLAAWATARDREDDDEAQDDEDATPGTAADDDATESLGPRHATDDVPRARWTVRLAVPLAALMCLITPSAAAAFATTTRSNASAWAVPNWSYTNEVLARNPFLYYKLDETGTATSADDQTPNNYDGTYSPNGNATNFTRLADGALVTDTPDRAVQVNTAGSCIFTPNAASRPAPGPQVFSEVVWFRTTAGYNLGGKLVGFENSRTGTASQYDRHVYMDGNGRLWFGVWTGATNTVSTPAAYNDGAWHMAVATLGPGGQRLYVDGVLRASSANTTPEVFSGAGWFRFGCGNLNAWGGAGAWSGPNAPTGMTTFRGGLDEVAVFLGELSAQDVSLLWFSR